MMLTNFTGNRQDSGSYVTTAAGSGNHDLDPSAELDGVNNLSRIGDLSVLQSMEHANELGFIIEVDEPLRFDSTARTFVTLQRRAMGPNGYRVYQRALLETK
jgi:hypothetical protein